MGGLLGRAKGHVATPAQIIGGGVPPASPPHTPALPTPMQLCVEFKENIQNETDLDFCVCFIIPTQLSTANLEQLNRERAYRKRRLHLDKSLEPETVYRTYFLCGSF